MTISDVVDTMCSRGVHAVLVADGSEPLRAGRVRGIITRREIGGAVIEAADLFTD
jgi:CBS domain-containing protein